MRRAAFVAATIAALCVSAGAAATTHHLTGMHKIRHVVVIMQENRSFDSYFGTYPGADGIPRRDGVATVCSPSLVGGSCVPPLLDHADINGGGPHEAGSAVADVANGLMNGFV